MLVIVYVFSLLLDGRTENVIRPGSFRAGPVSDLTLYFFPALLAVLMQFGSSPITAACSGEGRKDRGEGDGEPQGPPLLSRSPIRYGSLYNGLKLTRSTLIGSWCFPHHHNHPHAGFSSLNVEEVNSMLSNLDVISDHMVMLGLPITFLAFFKDSTQRLVLPIHPCVVMVLITLYWIWVLGLEGGSSSIRWRRYRIQPGLLQAAPAVDGGHRPVDSVLRPGALLHRPELKDAGFPKDLREERKARRRPCVRPRRRGGQPRRGRSRRGRR